MNTADKIRLPVLLLSAALIAATALALFSCSGSGGAKDTDTLPANLPTDAANTVGTADDASSLPAATDADAATTESDAPSDGDAVDAALAPVFPTNSGEGGGSLNTGVNIAGLSAAQNEFLSGAVFVGDSICSGIEIYSVLPDDNVLASTSNSAHDIDSYTFTVNGGEYDYLTALSMLDPATVIFFMGMNDTYLSSTAYCNNYTEILDKVHALLPDAEIYVASITPVSSECTYTTNDTIDEFNRAIRETVASLGYGYVDFSAELKGDDNCLLEEYSSGDGIHVPKEAYNRIISSVCAQLVK